MKSIAAHLRAKLVEMSHRARTPHLGSALSCVDILVAAYWSALNVDPKNPDDPERDRFILSKGHAVSALYATLAWRGYFPKSELEHYNDVGYNLPEQPSPKCMPGVELATGSLGHGLSVGLGMAYVAKLKGSSSRVFTLLSDGECNEGSVWEAAMLAPAKGLDNVLAVVDFNKWQATGRSEEVMSLTPFKSKWEAFGWDAREVDGHNIEALVREMSDFPNTSGKPRAIVAHTVKGKGVSFMEDDNNWHYRIPTEDEVVQAKEELLSNA